MLQSDLFSVSKYPVCGAPKCKREGKFKGYCRSHWTQNVYRQRPDIREKEYARFRTVSGRFTGAKAGAKKRKLAWELDKEQYAKLIAQPCHYCGNEKLGETGIGLDRIDNAKGYTLDNVLPCCPSCNLFRRDMLTVDEARCAIMAIVAYRKGASLPPYGFTHKWGKKERRKYD